MSQFVIEATNDNRPNAIKSFLIEAVDMIAAVEVFSMENPEFTLVNFNRIEEL
jgi:hypothetical protein